MNPSPTPPDDESSLVATVGESEFAAGGMILSRVASRFTRPYAISAEGSGCSLRMSRLIASYRSFNPVRNLNKLLVPIRL